MIENDDPIRSENLFRFCRFQLDLLETDNQLKISQKALQNNVGAKPAVDEAKRNQIEAQLAQMDEVKKQLDNQAKAIESERKLFEEQR